MNSKYEIASMLDADEHEINLDSKVLSYNLP